MSRVRIVLILTENWTLRPDVADLVTFAVEAERAGLDAVMVSEHVVLGPSADAAGLPANPRDYGVLLFVGFETAANLAEENAQAG